MQQNILMRINKLNILIFLMLFTCIVYAQKNEKRKRIMGTNTSFAVVGGPILPTSFVQKNNVVKTTDTSKYSVDNLMGYEFGMEIRHNFTHRFAIQSGINFIRRNFYAKADLYSTGEHSEEKLKLIAYELPIKGLAFVKLSNNVFMNIGGGVGIEMYPSDIFNPPFYGQRTSWIQLAMLTNIGWEYRTKIDGVFYLGLSYKMHFKDMAHIVYANSSGRRVDYVDVSGNYLSINLKYYFPIKK